MVTNSLIKVNFIKNILILLAAVFIYPVISDSLTSIKADQMNDFLLIVSILLVTVCFANFAFTYEKSNLQARSGKLLAHSATGVFMLLTVFLLESIDVAVKAVYPSLYFLVLGFSIMLYVGVVLYDFWDLMRAK